MNPPRKRSHPVGCYCATCKPTHVTTPSAKACDWLASFATGKTRIVTAHTWFEAREKARMIGQDEPTKIERINT